MGYTYPWNSRFPHCPDGKELSSKLSFSLGCRPRGVPPPKTWDRAEPGAGSSAQASVGRSFLGNTPRQARPAGTGSLRATCSARVCLWGSQQDHRVGAMVPQVQVAVLQRVPCMSACRRVGWRKVYGKSQWAAHSHVMGKRGSTTAGDKGTALSPLPEVSPAGLSSQLLQAETILEREPRSL